jgi:anti-sigma factor RsiW
MAELHLTAAQLEGYVRDTLDPRAEAELEAHVGACPRCALGLKAAARFELQLAEVASAAPPLAWRSAARLAPLVAVAAGVVALLLVPRSAPRPVFDDGEPWAPDAPSAVEAVSVRFDVSDLGRRTLPRYERMSPAPGSRLDAMALR